MVNILFSYGIYLAQNLARLVIKRGYKPFVVIRHENEASKSLYTKLGFVREYEMARIVWTPFDYIRGDNILNHVKDLETNGHHKTNGKHVNGETGKTNGVHNHHAA